MPRQSQTHPVLQLFYDTICTGIWLSFTSRKCYCPVHMDFHHILNLTFVQLWWIFMTAWFWVRQFGFQTNSVDLFIFLVTTKAHRKYIFKIPWPVKSLWMEHKLYSIIHPFIHTNSIHCETKVTNYFTRPKYNKTFHL